MYPLRTKLERRGVLRGEANATKCIFYWHATADESELLVSHEQLTTVSSMLFSAYLQARSDPFSAQSTSKKWSDGDENKADEHENATPSSPTEERGCVNASRTQKPTVIISGTENNASEKAIEATTSDQELQAGGPTQLLAEMFASPPPQRQKRLLTPQHLEVYSQALNKLNPLALPIGAFVSMFSSKAEYTRLTRCHRTGAICADDIVDCWTKLVRHVSEAILNSAFSRARIDSTDVHFRVRCPHAAQPMGPVTAEGPKTSSPAVASGFPAIATASISGVYVHRKSSTDFELGIVTYGLQSNGKDAEFIANFSKLLGVPFPFMHTTLPIGAALRSVSLKLWWTPQECRVTPGTPLAPIKVVLEELYRCDNDLRQRPTTTITSLHCSKSDNGNVESTNKEEDGAYCSFFRGYETVSWFLTRPITSQLRGTRTVTLPHTPASCAAYTQETVIAERRTERNDVGEEVLGTTYVTNPHMRAYQNVDFNDVPLSCGSVEVTRLSSGIVRASLWFTDFSVTTVGEHMLAVEVRPAAAYRPFVPILCNYVTPFLVVPVTEVCWE